jgi:hypothetical protein
MLSVIRFAKEAVRQALTAKTVGTRRSGRGLSRLSPEAIGKAINETDKQVNGIMLASRRLYPDPLSVAAPDIVLVCLEGGGFP